MGQEEKMEEGGDSVRENKRSQAQEKTPSRENNTDRHAWVREDSQSPVWLSRDQRLDDDQPQAWSGSLAEGRRENLEKGEQETKWWERRWERRKLLTQIAFIQGYEVASYPSLLLI